MITPEQINQTINETIVAAANENWTMFREGIIELAEWWRTMAHQTGEFSESRSSYVDMCKYIESSAVNITGDEFLRTKIKAELQEATKPKIIH